MLAALRDPHRGAAFPAVAVAVQEEDCLPACHKLSSIHWLAALAVGLVAALGTAWPAAYCGNSRTPDSHACQMLYTTVGVCVCVALTCGQWDGDSDRQHLAASS